LHLLQIQLRLFDLMLMHFLTMLSCSLPPVSHRALIKPKRMHDGLDWTAIRQQRNHQQHRLWFRSQPVENRPFRRRKRLLALIADVPFILLAM